MDENDKLERLLRAAAQAAEEGPVAAPFGFETRVVALWRSGAIKPNGLGSLLRRVALIAAAVLVISTVAAVREVKQNSEMRDSLTDEFAIADNAIQTEFRQ